MSETQIGITLENGIATIPPGSEIIIKSGEVRGLAIVLNTTLTALVSGKFVKNYLNLRTQTPQPVRLVNGKREFNLPEKSRITLPEIVAYIVS